MSVPSISFPSTIIPETPQSTVVKLTAKITAWYADPDPCEIRLSSASRPTAGLNWTCWIDSVKNWEANSLFTFRGRIFKLHVQKSTLSGTLCRKFLQFPVGFPILLANHPASPASALRCVQ